MTVIEVSENDFQREVIERSSQIPVVVDFWAEWCAPCRQLGPLLDAAAQAREGEVVLAKLDTDANPGLARAYGIQGIPAVKAFRDGAPVAEFVGAIPRVEVEAFFDALAPSEVEQLIAAGDEASLRRALELAPARVEAALPLARIVLAHGDHDEAASLLAELPAGFAADGLRSRLELERAGVLAEAFAAIDASEQARAFDLLLAALRQGDGEHEDVRRVLVGELSRLAPDDALARDTRRELAALLF